MDYNIPGVGSFNFKVLDTEHLIKGINELRPIIRGFIALLLLFFNIKMAIGFFRQDAGVVTGKAVDMSMKGEKK